MRQRKIPAVFMRGGTSKAIVFRQQDLPADRAAWDAIFLAAIGSPDTNARQLDGMGGGISSLSKVCVVGPPTHPEADIDFTFAQVSVRDATVDYHSNCGNMTSAMGPFAVDEALVGADGDEARVVIYNTNTAKLVCATFALDDGRAAVDGTLEIPGVAGSGAPVHLEFREPGGAGTGKLLPTGTHPWWTRPTPVCSSRQTGSVSPPRNRLRSSTGAGISWKCWRLSAARRASPWVSASTRTTSAGGAPAIPRSG
jgi:2-methylaconitate cis-trans-isomerase PrpF